MFMPEIFEILLFPWRTGEYHRISLLDGLLLLFNMQLKMNFPKNKDAYFHMARHGWDSP